jgi:hypothetical protein
VSWRSPRMSFVLLMMLPLAGGDADGSWGSPQMQVLPKVISSRSA